MPFNVKDALLKALLILPAGALTTTSTSIFLQPTSTTRDFVAEGELLVTVPALTTGQLPDTQTITYTVEMSDTSNFASPTTISAPLVQTGAGGVGAATATLRVGLPSTVQSYVRIKAVKTG